MYQRKRSIRLEADSDSRFDSPEDYFDAIGMDLPDSIRRSVPSLSNVASFLVKNEVLDMDEEAFTRRLEEG